jgi:formylmethanofuran dehydrogenase subunit E
MTVAALTVLREDRAEDEELVAIVENDACGVDAVQYLAGCTFGKGNLIFRDYGKSVYTFYSRGTGNGVRVSWQDGALPAAVRADRAAAVDWILSAPQESLMTVHHVHLDPPARAVIRNSVVCDACGERVMETKTHTVDGQTLCIPCWRERTKTED